MTSSQLPGRRECALAFGLTFVLFLPFALLGLDSHHDGTMLKPALDVWAGQVLYRDTFSQYGPLTTWIHTAFLHLLGPTLFSMRVSGVFFYALTAPVLLSLWSLLLPRARAWASLAIWLGLAPFFATDLATATVFHAWSSVYALFFQALGALALTLAFLEDGERGFELSGLVAGVSCALAFLCRQPVGMATGAAFAGACVVAWRPRVLRELCLGFAVTLGLATLHLWLGGALGHWYEQTYVWPRRWVSSEHGANAERILTHLFRRRNEAIVLSAVVLASAPLLRAALRRAWASGAGRFSRLLPQAGIACVAALLFWRFPKALYQSAIYTAIPVTGLFFTAWLFFKGRGRERALALALGALSTASWMQFFPVYDSRHVYWAVSPMIGLFVFWLGRWLGERPAWIWTLLAVWLANTWVSQAPAIARSLLEPRFRLEHPKLRWIGVNEATARSLNPMFGALAEAQARLGRRPIVVEGPDAFYAIFTDDLRNIHRFPMCWKVAGFHATHFDAEGIRFVEEKRPIIFTEGGDGTLPASVRGYRPALRFPELMWGFDATLWLPAG